MFDFMRRHCLQVLAPGTEFVCHRKLTLLLPLQDPHVNAFFRQCQKREKDMSQSPTSSFVRACKVTCHADSLVSRGKKTGKENLFLTE